MQNTKNTKKPKKAFTLVELIIVITILAILATVAFLSFNSYTKNSRDSVRLVNITDISKALEIHKVSTGNFPQPENISGTGRILGVDLFQVGQVGSQVSSLLKFGSTPVDPLNKKPYSYGLSMDNKYFQVAGTLENINAHNTLSATTYANNQYKAKVLGNYKGILTFSTGSSKYVGNIPSLIFSRTGPYNLLVDEPYFVVNNGKNLPYVIDTTSSGMTQGITEVLSSLGNTATSITGVLAPTSKQEVLALSGALGLPGDVIGQEVLGTQYFVSTPTVSVAGPVQYTVSACPVVNLASNGMNLTRDQILQNITNYIGCSLSGVSGKIAGYTYSGSIINDNKMIMLIHNSDTSTGATWGLGSDIPGITAVTNPSNVSTVIESWDGLANTKTITNYLNGQGFSNSAAQLCNALSSGGQTWYLPGSNELNEIYCYSQYAGGSYYGNSGWNNANCVGSGYPSTHTGAINDIFSNMTPYWSSTPFSGGAAFGQTISIGQKIIDGHGTLKVVRCVSRI